MGKMCFILSLLLWSFWGLIEATVDVKNFAKFTGIYLCQCLFFGLNVHTARLLKYIWTFSNAFNFFKKTLWHRCLPMIFAKCLRTPLSQNTSGVLLLFIMKDSFIVNVSAIFYVNAYSLKNTFGCVEFRKMGNLFISTQFDYLFFRECPNFCTFYIGGFILLT